MYTGQLILQQKNTAHNNRQHLLLVLLLLKEPHLQYSTLYLPENIILPKVVFAEGDSEPNSWYIMKLSGTCSPMV